MQIFNKNFIFYSVSFLVIIFLLCLFNQKMEYTYEAKNNSIIFKRLSESLLSKKYLNINDLKLSRKNDIDIVYHPKLLNIRVNNTNYRSCLKYGVEYIDSNFQSIKINDYLFTRKDVINRDKILEKCNKENNIVILEENLEKK